MLETSKGYHNKHEIAQFYFYELMMNTWVEKELFDAVFAGYEFSFGTTHNGLEMSFGGY